MKNNRLAAVGFVWAFAGVLKRTEFSGGLGYLVPAPARTGAGR
ncbi:hypothetical protein ABH939_006666 [Rhodococcus sp. 27YEA6]